MNRFRKPHANRHADQRLAAGPDGRAAHSRGLSRLRGHWAGADGRRVARGCGFCCA